MDIVLRSVAFYLLLFLVFRLLGKRTLAQVTAFDLVLLLIISEVAQNALMSDTRSVSGAMLVVLTLLVMERGLDTITTRWPKVGKWFEDVPLVLVENGKPLESLCKKARVTESEILAAARSLQGLTHMSQIKYAILETNGEISIIPQPGAT